MTFFSAFGISPGVLPDEFLQFDPSDDTNGSNTSTRSSSPDSDENTNFHHEHHVIYEHGNEQHSSSLYLSTSPPQRPFNIPTMMGVGGLASNNSNNPSNPTNLPFGVTPPTIRNLERFVCNPQPQGAQDPRHSPSAQLRPQESFCRPISPPPQSPLFQPAPSPLSISRPGSTVDWTLRLFHLQDFIFGKTVGTGTFGRVRLAKLRDHEKYFAMKIMRKEDIFRLHQVDHIFSEKFLLSRLSCPFIIRLYGTFQDVDRLYMLLEYAIGGELFTYLRRAGRFSTGATKFYAAEIICALQYMHALGIVYRDLKPENLLLDSRGHIKIADFGFAKVIPDNRTWTLCGTPEYLAPEIILGRGHGRPVDWWALGVLIYEMMAGFPPYYDETPFLIYEKILAGKLEFPSHFEPALQDLLTGLLQADPQRRLGSGAHGAEDVKEHPWFANDVNWDAIARKLTAAPFIPPVNHPGDTANFEEYPEDDAGDLLLSSSFIQNEGGDPELNRIFAEF